ncbi:MULTISPECIES: DNA-binding anti-repressor SinI [Priestia]|nr:DNA-binding anti-repressor SinI [Priestia megaterium]
MTDKLKEKVDLEKEWILLMKQAYEMGLSIEEVKNFVQESKRN